MNEYLEQKTNIKRIGLFRFYGIHYYHPDTGLYCIFNFASFAKYEIATFCLFSKSGNEVRAEVDNPIVENGCSSQSCFS